jgi:hypothetical protein
MGETGGIADPFADGGPRLADGHDETQDGFDATRDEAAPSDSSRGPLRRGDNEENVIAVVGDEPEPDSQPGYAAAEETGPAGDSAPTVDLPQTDLESLRTPSFVKDVEEGGGSEGLTMNKGRDLAGGPAHDDLRDVDAAPPLDADEARAREEETGDPDATGPEGDSQADTATVEDEQEPDFLYGERFSDKFQVPEGPPPKPSRAPQIIAAVAGVILLGAAVAVVGKYASQREFVPGTDIPTVRPVVAPPEPKRDPGATSRPQPLRPTNPGESTPEPRPAVVTPPPKPADVPPPLPSPTDAIGVKIRRALSWGLPIEPPKDAAAQPPKPQGGDR